MHSYRLHQHRLTLSMSYSACWSARTCTAAAPATIYIVQTHSTDPHLFPSMMIGRGAKENYAVVEVHWGTLSRERFFTVSETKGAVAPLEPPCLRRPH